MSKPTLSKMDHRKAEDVQYLVQPRGPGKSWVFRMVTPLALLGLPNPRDGKRLGKEIKRGLATRHLPDARKRRDILLGDLRQLEAQQGDKGAFSLPSAFEWREAIAADAAANPDDAHGRLEMLLHGKLQAAAARGFPVDQLRRFSRVATGKGYPLERALAEYIEARRPGNPSQFKPISQSTVDNLKTAAKHLRAFLRDTDNTVCLEDLTPEASRRFRVEYLPRLTGRRNPHGMAAKTVEKNITLLAGVWIWAGDVGKTPKRYGNPWVFQSGIKRTAKAAQSREDFKPQEAAKLLAASLRGTRQGDLLRLAFATGCRIDEIATLKTDQVRVDGSGFRIARGKNANALRFVPVVADAQTLLAARVAAHGASGRLFCQRRSKNRPRGGAKAGHFLARLSPPGGRSPSGGLKRALRFSMGSGRRFGPDFARACSSRHSSRGC
ncbi:tyrosine-type recombinase/integrase [Paracoccus zhejiangensis]|uniref:Core-binding (CB) domain-containing protein n=1 Tax=Paracoccus zhejiangensis TaxID=1077935 RepID=A0A2H5EWR5_9RHOB|nr:tyrosine-type recombinase/integrase [Paracoccus zhejiangensis]AUH63739.1 hypothetical protein CX676_05850 [Paracoccus zhejiangensis]